MRSRRGFLAALVFLSLLPVAVLYQMFFDNEVEIITHGVLALGSALISFAVFDFKATNWLTWLGCISTSALAAIFLLQGVSLLIQNEALTYLVFQVLGQRLEAGLVDVLLVWFVALLLMDSQGKTRIFGFVAMSIVVCFEIYKYSLAYFGAAPAESLKLLFLLPMVWFLFERKKEMTMKTDKVLTSFTHLMMLVALAMTLCLTASPARATSPTVTPVRFAAQTAGLTDPKELEAFLASLMVELMESNHIPGGAIVVVKDGQRFFAQGYGYADLERRTLAAADTTLFRAGSLSKVFTWTAVMQLVEQGKLDLNRDVNTYLTHFQIPATFPQPITLAHLMTHTTGFEDQLVNGTVYASPEGYRPLPDFLADKVPGRIFPPGQVVAYSNYGAALAGEIVAEVSGEPFEQYIAHHILQPLAMNHSTFLQPLPPELAQAVAVGYAVDEAGLRHPGSFEFIQVQPAGVLSTTATDMAHFMIAQLQDGRYGDQRILQAASAQDMRRQSYAFDPRLPGMTRGFAEAYRNDIHLVFHMGSTDRSSSLLALLPDQNLGIFMAFNSYINGSTRQALLNILLDHYYPVSAPPAVSPPGDFAQRAANFSGSYLSTQRAETNWGKLAALILARIAVTVNPDGTLTVDAFRDSNGLPKRWVEVAPRLFQEAGGRSRLAFSVDAHGRITAMFNSDQPILAFQKVAWYEDPQTHLIGLGLAVLLFLVTVVVWSLEALLRRIKGKASSPTSLERWGRTLAGGLILVNLMVVGFVTSVLMGDESAIQFGYPAGLTSAGILALVSSVGALAVLAFSAGAWWQRAWGLVGRLHYTLIALATLYFVWYLNEVNLLRF